MKRYLIPILVILLLASGLVVGCGQEVSPTPKIQPDVSKMNGAEVCQYVNQALPSKYVYRTPALRYEYRYTALSAQYIGGSVWKVSVRETVEYQRLYEGQWTPFPGTSSLPVSQTAEYILNEATGAVTQQ